MEEQQGREGGQVQGRGPRAQKRGRGSHEYRSDDSEGAHTEVLANETEAMGSLAARGGRMAKRPTPLSPAFEAGQTQFAFTRTALLL